MDKIFPKDTIKNTADSIGITNLKDNAAAALALDAEYRIHEIIQEANKFMRHSKRTKLTGEDINNALRVVNVDVTGQQELLFMDDDEYEFENLITSPMPKLPAEVTYTAHWLAVEGVQPAIPHNPPPPIEESSRKKAPSNAIVQVPNGVVTGTPDIELKPLVQHVISQELKVFYDKVTKTIKGGDSKMKVSVLYSLQHDTGLAQLLPYFVRFICEQIGQNIKKNTVLESILEMTDALINNTSLRLEPYKFGLDPEYHWRIRDSAARVLAKICDRFGLEYNTLQPRVIKTLLSALIDQTKTLSTHYGCIVALGALGREVIKTILVPNLKTYSEILEQRKKLDKNKAERCENAIMDILPKLKGSSIPMDESQMSDEELQQKLEDKIGAQFAKQVMDKIEDKEVIMAILNC
ncbi:4231_t:CDS:2 [Racocetra fulgida]|uniref:TBP-associated factor 6 n=1 Tax=Racocetra fulgida TaxID=60492 RepID=A0A9N8ZU65_9GLOM|nr:4231_t:CDS:2 [Racocetra fulgida]